MERGPQTPSASLAGLQPYSTEATQVPHALQPLAPGSVLPALKPKGSASGQLDVIVLSGTLLCSGEMTSYHLVPIFHS